MQPATPAGIIAESVLGFLAFLFTGYATFIFSRITKRFTRNEAAISRVKSELSAMITQAVQNMSTALVTQEGEFQRLIANLSDDITRRLDEQTRGLTEAVRALAVITTRYERTSQQTDSAVSDIQDLRTLTAVLKERLDRHEEWSEREHERLDKPRM